MLGKVIRSIPRKIVNFKTDILVIDDGSVDQTSKIAKNNNVCIIRHLINRGLGAALATGFEYAINNHYQHIVTFDADGQHQPQDIPQLLTPLIAGKADIVIGSRLIQPNSMPFFRRIINYLSNIATFLLFNVWTTDSQSGLRAFNIATLKRIHLNSQRMEVSSEIFKEINRLKLRLVEVPIQTIYTAYSLRKGQPIENAPGVLWKLIQHALT